MLHLLPHFIHDRVAEGATRGSLIGSALFADLSGFTAATERYMRLGKEGIEILSEVLNGLFKPIIDEVHRSGGFICTFAGDALTAVFPGDTQREALRAGVAIRASVAPHETFSVKGRPCAWADRPGHPGRQPSGDFLLQGCRDRCRGGGRTPLRSG